MANHLNRNENNWKSNDNDKDYAGEVTKSFWDSLLDDVWDGLEKGAVIGGCAIGIPGAIVGGLVGAIVGGLRALIVKPLTKAKPPNAPDLLGNFFNLGKP